MNKRVLIIFIVLFFLIASPSVLGASKTPTAIELQKKITALTKQVRNLTTSLANKNKENTTLKKDKSNLQNEIKRKDRRIEEQEMELDNLKDLLEEKDLALKEQDKKIKQMDRLSKAEITYTARNLNTGNDVKWYKFNTQQTTIYLTASAYDKFGYIVDISDELLEDVGMFFGTKRLTEPVSTYIWFGDEVNSTTTFASYSSNENKVFINGAKYYPFNSSNEENFIGAYVHEFSHAFEDITFKLFGDDSGVRTNILWLTEGVADYVDHQMIEYKKYEIPKEQLTMNYKYNKEIMRMRILRNLEGNGEPVLTKLPTKQFKGYETYESLVFFIEYKYGHEKLIDFMKAFKTQNLNEALMSILGVTENELLNDWKNYYSL